MGVIQIRATARGAVLFASGTEREAVAEILKVVDQQATVAFLVEGQRCVACSLALGRDAGSMQWRRQVSAWAKDDPASRIVLCSYEAGVLQDLDCDLA